MPDLRNHSRTTTDRPITVTLSDGKQIQAKLETISCGGISLLYSAPAEVDAALSVSFQLIYKSKNITIQAETLVRYCHVKGDDFISGLEFVHINKSDLKIIQNFVEQRITNAVNNVSTTADYRNNERKL